MARFGGMHEKRRRAGGGERGGGLARHMAGLAQTRDDQSPPGVANEIGRGGKRDTEIGLQRRGQRGDAAGFGIEGAQSRRHGSGCRIGPG